MVKHWVAASSPCYYSIASYLNKPSDLVYELRSQQLLEPVLEALDKQQQMCVILIDSNFNGPGFQQGGSQQQIVAYLRSQNYLVVDKGTQGDASTFLVGGVVTIIYVGRNVYDEMAALLKQTGAQGGWYSELK